MYVSRLESRFSGCVGVYAKSTRRIELIGRWSMLLALPSHLPRYRTWSLLQSTTWRLEEVVRCEKLRGIFVSNRSVVLFGSNHARKRARYVIVHDLYDVHDVRDGSTFPQMYLYAPDFHSSISYRNMILSYLTEICFYREIALFVVA